MSYLSQYLWYCVDKCNLLYLICECAPLVILKVFFGTNQSFSPLLYFSLRGKLAATITSFRTEYY